MACFSAVKDYLKGEIMSLSIENIQASIQSKPILQNISLSIGKGEIHALMGPNGSGKSTLANVIMGHPSYTVSNGKIWFKDVNILDLLPDERARLGLYLAFQYPTEVPGITIGKFLKRSLELQNPVGKRFNISAYVKELKRVMDYLEIDQNFINRYLNEGFSGGEKKKMEICQMLMLKPTMAILDETDSGLDIDALKIIAKGVNQLRTETFSALIITHYQRLLTYIKPDHVHIMYKGKIVESGGSELVEHLESAGYDWIKRKHLKAEAEYEANTVKS